MTPPSYADFKYQHEGTGLSTGRLVFLGVVALAFAFVLLRLGTLDAFVPMLVIFIILAFFVWPKKRIRLGARWLLCGNKIVYYGNVSRMTLQPGKSLALYAGRKQFVLERDRFPTNARKDHKVQANKTAKFDKVSAKIIRHVLLASPTVELKGIDRARHLAEAAE